MKQTAFRTLAFFSLILLSILVHAQTGPWAKYDATFKGYALVREADAGNLEEVKSIVAGGGNVNYQLSYTFLTPLMAAASANKPAVVEYLLQQGAKPELKDNNGKTALDRARAFGATDVVKLLASRTKIKDTNTTTPTPAVTTKPAPVNNAPAVNKVTIQMPVTNSTSWPALGTYRVGDSILFYAGSWKRGTIKEIGTAYNAAAKNAATGENKYLIVPDAYNWPEWMDWSEVVGLSREGWWTNWFIGTWNLGEVMAVNTRTEGSYEHNEYSYHKATDVLQVLANGSYFWKTMDGKTFKGKWSADPAGPGIIIEKGYKGLNWTLRNQSSAITMHIRKLESGRLFPPAGTYVMGIAATRKMK
jgi:hypothetical protein